MRVGFLVRWERGKDVVISVFHHAREDRPPLVTFARNANGCAVLLGRLYYQDDLLAACGRLESDRPTSAAASALLAYERLGTEGLARLEGDFSCVVFDQRESRLLGLRDPTGGYPLFWHHDGGGVTLSTFLKPLADLKPGRRLNLEYLADFLVVPSPFNEHPNARCIFEGVARLGPGTMIELQLPSDRVRMHRQWDWLARRTDPGTHRIEEIGEEYRRILSRAVAQRLAGPVASHLSGGMDSTAVAMLANEAIRQGVSPGPLHAISLLYTRLPTLARESPYLQEALENRDYAAHSIDGDDVLDFDSFADPPLHDEPYIGLFRLGLDRATIRVADEHGAATLLTGIGADELLDVAPLHITDLLRRGHWLAAWRESTEWARSSNCNVWNVLYPYGIANLLASHPVWPLSRRGVSPLRKERDWTIAPWILPQFVRRHALRERVAENARMMYGRAGSAALSFALHSIESRCGDVVRWSVAAPLGISLAHPFLDSRVLSLGLGIMSRLKPSPGHRKPVLARAMHNLLPQKILNRPHKGHFNEVYFLGLSRNLRHIQQMIESSRIAELEMFDKDVLMKYVEEASFGGAHVRQLHRMSLSLALIKWLALQESWFSAPMPPSETISMALATA